MIEINSSEIYSSLRRITGKLGKLGEFAEDNIINAVNPAVVRLMQIYEPWKKVTRLAAYGQTFQSDKQRRWFFAALRDGTIDVPYRRTFAMKNAWVIRGRGRSSSIVNDSAGAIYAMGSKTQSPLHKLMGWKTVEWRLQHPGREFANAAINGIRDAIKRAGL